MSRTVNVFLVSGALSVSLPLAAAAQEADATPQPEKTASAATEPPAEETASNTRAPSVEVRPELPSSEWSTEVHGYFRAPLALGISSRPNPDKPDGPSNLQWSYAPNRVVDWSYYSFAYTRLQEQDWAELTVHAKKKHVDAAIGWMGYWLAATGFRNADAAATPGIAYLTLDSDFRLGNMTPNAALSMGAWWPGFGYFEKYDTFTLGRFRQMGEQLKLTFPLNPDLTLTFVEGFGTGRDGSFSYSVANNSPLYASKVGADLIAYSHLQISYQKLFDAGIHYNYEWTRDPRLTAEASPTDGKAYSDAAAAHLSVFGAEANLRAPYLGHLWISPSYISVKNGWALGGGGGTEVMHSQNGLGIATNYLAFTNSPADSTGTGSMLNVGFLYENSLSNVQGLPVGTRLPDVRASVFGLLANANLDLPAGSKISQNTIRQFKFGGDVTLQAVDWFSAMLRWDQVNYDLDHPGYIFSAITSRLTISSHYLSGESIYLQYSRYRYGDKMVLAGQWPWGNPLVEGSNQIQNIGPYFGKEPDENVLKLQATVAF